MKLWITEEYLRGNLKRFEKNGLFEGGFKGPSMDDAGEVFSFFKRSSLIMEALARNCWKQMLVGSGRLNSLEKTRNLKWKTGRHKFRKVKKR